MRYAPERVYMDEGRKERVYDECWTGEWWWETQVSKAAEAKIKMKSEAFYYLNDFTISGHTLTQQ